MEQIIQKNKFFKKILILIMVFVTLLTSLLSITTVRAISLSKIAGDTIFDSEYGFTFKFISGTTTIETYGMTNYPADHKFTSANNNSTYSQSNWYSARLTSNDQKGNIWIRYNNVGVFEDKIIDLKITVTGWSNLQPANKNASSSLDGVNYPTLFFKKNAIDIASTTNPSIDSPVYKFDFLEHGTDNPINLKGHITFFDIDGGTNGANEFMIPTANFTEYYVSSDTELSVSSTKILNNTSNTTTNTDKKGFLTAFFSGTSITFTYGRLQDVKGNGYKDITQTVGASQRGAYHFAFASEPLAPFDFDKPMKTVDKTKITTDDELTYKIYHYVPISSSSNYYTSYQFTDIIQSALEIIDVKVFDGTDIDRTDWFDISTNHNLVTISATETSIKNASFYNETFIFTIKTRLNDSYDFTSLYRDDSKKTIINNQANIAITANYKSDTKTSNNTEVEAVYKLTTSMNHGTITESDNNVPAGSERQVTYTPDDGYYIESVTVDGKPKHDFNILGDKLTLKFNEDHDVVVKTHPLYKVDTKINNGTITKSEDHILPNSDKKVDFKPNKGYHITSVVVDGKPQDEFDDTGDSVTFDDILDNHTVTITTEPYRFSIKGTKVDAETHASIAQSTATLQGAEIAVYYKRGWYSSDEDEPYSDNEEVCRATTNENGIWSCPSTYPVGNYVIKEVKAPEGYNLSLNEYSFTHEDDTEVTYQVEDTLIKGNLNIYKTFSSTNNKEVRPEEGAKFEVKAKSSNNPYKKVITTNGSGTATLNDIPYGEYTICQIDGHKDYWFADCVDLSIKEEGVTITKNLTDPLVEVKIRLTDHDSENNRNIKRQGIKFDVYDAETNEKVGTYETDENGVLVTEPLPAGDYYLKQQDQSIDGYLWSRDVIEFTIDNQQDYTDADELGLILDLDFYNDPVKGTFSITKVGEVASYENGLRYEKLPLKNVTFKIFALDNIYDGTGQLLFEKDALVATIKTNNEGYAEIALPLGKYYYRETKTPKGYILDKTKQQFSLRYHDQYTPTIWFETSMQNFLEKGSIQILKTDSLSRPLEDVEFKLYTATNDYVATGLTNSEGIIEFSNLPLGKYYVVESKTLKGYVLDNLQYNLEIVSDNQLVEMTIKNNKYSSVTIHKLDTKNNPLEDVTIRIYNAINDELIFEGKTDENGTVILTSIDIGEYYYQEVATLDGYILNNSKNYFLITEYNKNYEYTLINEKYSKLEIYKRDSETNMLLSGAEFCIFNQNEEIVGCITTNESGYAIFNHLLIGKYYLTEITAPEGYQLDLNKYEFEIIDDGDSFSLDLFNKKIEEVPPIIIDVENTGRNDSYFFYIELLFLNLLLLTKIVLQDNQGYY